MRRVVSTLFLAMALAPVALAPAAPVPRGAGPRYFYPTRVGDRMVSALSDDREFTTRVTKVEKVAAGLRVTVNLKLDDGTERFEELMEVSAEGLQMISCTHRRELPHPHWPLKYTPDANRTWTGKWAVFSQGGDVFEEQEYTSTGWETVEVPAGTFRAVRVDRVGVLQGIRNHCTCWYALDVGCVKWTFGPTVGVLKSFSRGPN